MDGVLLFHPLTVLITTSSSLIISRNKSYCILCIKNLTLTQPLSLLRALLKTIFSKKLKPCSSTMVMNTWLSNPFSHPMASPTLQPFPIHWSTMAAPNVGIVTLSTSFSLFSTKPTFLSPFGCKLLLQRSTS